MKQFLFSIIIVFCNFELFRSSKFSQFRRNSQTKRRNTGSGYWNRVTVSQTLHGLGETTSSWDKHSRQSVLLPQNGQSLIIIPRNCQRLWVAFPTSFLTSNSIILFPLVFFIYAKRSGLSMFTEVFLNLNDDQKTACVKNWEVRESTIFHSINSNIKQSDFLELNN